MWISQAPQKPQTLSKCLCLEFVGKQFFFSAHHKQMARSVEHADGRSTAYFTGYAVVLLQFLFIYLIE